MKNMREILDLINNATDVSDRLVKSVVEVAIPIGEANSPSRLLTHIRNGIPFFMISAFRSDLDHEINIMRAKNLKADLNHYPVAVIKTEGEYQEIGSEVPSRELSLFVMARDPKKYSSDYLLSLGKKLMIRYQQDSIAYGDGEDIALIFQNGDAIFIGNTVTFNQKKIDDIGAFSVIKGRKFSFAPKDERPSALAEDSPDYLLDE